MKDNFTALFFATRAECDIILSKLSFSKEIRVFDYDFIKGKIAEIPLVVCISGIGKINSSLSAILAFKNFHIKKAIISGIAGAYPSSGLKVGDIAIAEREIEADTGLLINCENKDNSFIFIKSEEILMQVPPFCEKLKKGTFLTLSSSTGNLNRAKFLEKKFKAICENMEGFAVAKAAKIYNIPAVEIRSISNIVTDRRELLKLDEIKQNARIVQKFILESLPLFAGHF